MGKDFRIGLILGLMLAIGGLIWVATRPSLSPEARMRRTLQARSQDFGLPETPKANLKVADTEPIAPDSQRSAPIPEATRPQTDDPGSPASTAANPQSEIRNPPSNALPDLTVYEQDEPIKTTRFHIVRRGETLSAIARQYYNSPNDWRRILTANPNVKDANRIAPGTKLIIPE